MLRSVHVKAPAKLNLHLKVCDVRPDGFHDIESIFQKVPLYDDLLIEMVDSNCTCQVISPDFILPFENTLTSAYKAFCSCTGIKDGVRITLRKRIPSGAGMGGGSSDAAAVLSGLSELFCVELSAEQKYNVASQIGSDVFFFLRNGEAYDAAIVSGRGEHVRYIVPRRDLYFVLLCPGVHSATGEAYSLVDSWHDMDRTEITPFKELEDMYRKPVNQWVFYNSFTEPLAWKFPEIKRALSDLRQCEADYVQMTGSGSVVFGVFASEKDAHKSYDVLRNEWDDCYYLASR
ncbi:MAG: 4-(cytidine 5'-diphospho)-2-C-methyl-D-erythritol kinase [Treponemataceae bacterium]|nr:4-(cytidine 5'-diphospho)-2-C-methyl-D-erythritol kinase [Treponemataceae bacterium]